MDSSSVHEYCEAVEKECRLLKEMESELQEELFVMGEESELYRAARQNNYSLAYKLNEEFQREAELGSRLEKFLGALVAGCPDEKVRDMIHSQIAQTKYISLEATQALVQDQRSKADRAARQAASGSSSFFHPRSLALESRSLEQTSLPELQRLGSSMHPPNSTEMLFLKQEAAEWRLGRPDIPVAKQVTTEELAEGADLQKSFAPMDTCPYLLLQESFSPQNRLIPLDGATGMPLDGRSFQAHGVSSVTHARALPSPSSSSAPSAASASTSSSWLSGPADIPSMYSVSVGHPSFEESFLPSCTPGSLASWLQAEVGPDGFPVAALRTSQGELVPSAGFFARCGRHLLDLHRFVRGLPHRGGVGFAAAGVEGEEEEEEEDEDEEEEDGMVVDEF